MASARRVYLFYSLRRWLFPLRSFSSLTYKLFNVCEWCPFACPSICLCSNGGSVHVKTFKAQVWHPQTLRYVVVGLVRAMQSQQDR